MAISLRAEVQGWVRREIAVTTPTGAVTARTHR
jgi:hypothetical protein